MEMRGEFATLCAPARRRDVRRQRRFPAPVSGPTWFGEMLPAWRRPHSFRFTRESGRRLLRLGVRGTNPDRPSI